MSSAASTHGRCPYRSCAAPCGHFALLVRSPASRSARLPSEKQAFLRHISRAASNGKTTTGRARVLTRRNLRQHDLGPEEPHPRIVLLCRITLAASHFFFLAAKAVPPPKAITNALSRYLNHLGHLEDLELLEPPFRRLSLAISSSTKRVASPTGFE